MPLKNRSTLAVEAPRRHCARFLHARRKDTFYWWRRNLESAAKQPPAFLPVEVVGAANALPAPAAVIEIVLANGRCLRVSPGFDPKTLVTLVALLETGEAAC